jgi:hypothetical protein
MLPLACLCVPVLAVVIAGLLTDRRYLDGLRRMRQTSTPVARLVDTSPPAATGSVTPAAKAS